MTSDIARFVRSRGPDLDEQRRQRSQLPRRPMLRYAEDHEHLQLDKLLLDVSASVTKSEPQVAPVPEQPASTPEPLAIDRRGMVRVFSFKAICAARDLLSGVREAERKRFEAILDRAERDDGWRTLPWRALPWKDTDLDDPFGDLGPEYANFRDVIEHLRTQWTCASRALDSAAARIDPILLVGDPGVGKTHFASALASRLQVRMDVYSAGSAVDAMQLCGSDARWYNSRPGLVYDALSLGDSAAPILVVDEIDKMAPHSGGNRDTPLNSLLDLLEPESACRYRDMSVQLAMDASHVLVIATANDAQELSASLRSRLTEFHVQPPTAEQRRLIIERQFGALFESHQCRDDLELDEASVEAAAETPDLDVRSLLRMLRTGFARALVEDLARVTVAPPRRELRRKIGFV
jgi:ATP-dependent Lon protease